MSFASKVTGYNSAVSYGLKNAVSGTYPAFDIDYPQVLVARGDLPNASAPFATATGGGMVDFKWANNAGVGTAKATDKAILVVYCPFIKQTIYTTGPAVRSSLSAQLDVTPFVGQAVETYIAFVSGNDKNVATSIYTGHLQIT